MLWELKQTEGRLREIEIELKALARDTTLSTKDRQARQRCLAEEQTRAQMRCQQLVSHISADRVLSKQLDERRDTERIKPLPEAERGLVETQGKLPPKKLDRAALQSYLRDRSKMTLTEREIENAKLLEQEREPD